MRTTDILITKGLKVTNSDTGRVETIKEVVKKGRWVYVTVGNNPPMTEKQFHDTYKPEAPRQQAEPEAPRVKKVSAAHVQDAMTASDIEEGTIEGLTGFAKFRALHKPVTVVLENSGVKARLQDNGDGIAHQLIVEIDEVMAAKGIEASEAIWLTPVVKNNLDVKALKAKYAHLNYGMIRMNIGNMLRNIFRKAAKDPAK